LSRCASADFQKQGRKVLAAEIPLQRQGKKCLALDVYPRVGLKLERTRSDDARRLLTDGIDPGEHKKIARAARVDAAENRFEAVALEWLVKQKPTWAESHWTKIEAMLKRDLFPDC
jgi:Phage integrase central domain